jgi:hypothetical protein
MEEPRLFGDIYDIVTCLVMIAIGMGLLGYSFISDRIGFLYAGSALIVVFAGLLLFSYYARHKNRFAEFSADPKSIIATALAVLLILATVIGAIVFVAF